MAEQTNTTTAPAAPAPTGAPADTRPRNTFRRGPGAGGDNRGAGGQGGGFQKNPRRFSRSDTKVKPEFDQKIISIRRVTRVVSGGRRFSFSVALVAGDRKGMVGIGLGKAGDTALAIEKALKNAKKNFVKIPATKDMSIPYEVSAKYASSRVTITPNPGRGIVAGSSVRSIIELAGLKDIGAKLRSGSKNKINNARVAIEALRTLTPHRRVLLSQRKANEPKQR
ncbi:MAG: 30S ribosomal protein S5 [bacterium]|nr:30S ribosomal protein S5 [bacterium]